eukprot:5600914-Pleurochrysis_carterae.AAC.4
MVTVSWASASGKALGLGAASDCVSTARSSHTDLVRSDGMSSVQGRLLRVYAWCFVDDTAIMRQISPGMSPLKFHEIREAFRRKIRKAATLDFSNNRRARSEAGIACVHKSVSNVHAFMFYTSACVETSRVRAGRQADINLVHLQRCARCRDVHAEELFCAHGEVCSLRVAQTTTSSGAWQMHVSRCMVCQGEGLTAHVRGKRCKSMLNSHTKGLVCCEGVKWARSQPCVELHTFPWSNLETFILKFDVSKSNPRRAARSRTLKPRNVHLAFSPRARLGGSLCHDVMV